MKINKLFLAATILATSFSACSSDDKVVGAADGAINFSSSINGEVAQSRASNASWANGDAIGVFMKKGAGLTSIVANGENKKYTTTTGDGKFAHATSSDALYFPEDGSTVDFIAYYPYTASLSNTTYSINTATQTSQEAIDLLYSDDATGNNATNTTVNLNFKHKLSKAVFTVTAGAGIPDLNGLTVTIKGMKTTANFDLGAGTISGEAAVADIAMKVSGSGTQMIAEAIILPEGGVAGRIVSFKLPSGTFDWNVPTVNEFQEGKKHLFDVTLKSSSTDPEIAKPNGTITDWGEGSSESITLTPNTGTNDGTFAKPYTAAEALTKAGENAKWITGYIVGSKATSFAIGAPVNTNILLAEVAGETDESKCIAIDIDGSTVQGNLDIVANPTLIGALVKVQGDIATAVLGAVGMKNVVAQNGGAEIVDPNKPIKFFEETFDARVLENKEKVSIANFANDFDMKAPVTYTDLNGFFDIRALAGNNHVWLANSYSGTDKTSSFVITGFESGYTGVVMTFDLASAKKDIEANIIKIKFDGNEITMPSYIFPSLNVPETFTVDVPDGTTKIEFYSGNDNEAGYRLDNIILEGKKP